jgi:TonB family protein
MKTFLYHLILAGAAGALLTAAQAVEQPTDTRAAAPDVPLKIIRTVAGVFPTRVLEQGVSHGEATVVFHVDSAGKLTDWLVTSYTHRDLANEGVRVLRAWRFEPGFVAGRPVGTVASITFEFEVRGMLVIEKRPELTMPTVADYMEARYAYQPCPAERLDRRLTPIRTVKPTYPKELSDHGAIGNVRVVFYVDENGQARLPVAANAPDNVLAGMAVAAVGQWRFAPPTSQGKPVLVRACQDFSFVPGE